MSKDGRVVRILREMYEQKLRMNHRFSVRAFARQLELSDSTLSQILRGKRVVGPALARHLESKLGVALAVHASREQQKKRKLKRAKVDYKSLTLETNFEPPWYYLSVLEFLQLHPSREDLVHAAAQLGVYAGDLDRLIENFIQLGWVEEQGGRLSPVERSEVFLSPPVTNAVAKSVQLGTLESSKQALLEKDFSSRIHNSLYFAFAKDDLPKLRKSFDRFLDDITAISTKGRKKADGIYGLSLSAFPIIERKGHS